MLFWKVSSELKFLHKYVYKTLSFWVLNSEIILKTILLNFKSEFPCLNLVFESI
jgi:hypothetical protein